MTSGEGDVSYMDNEKRSPLHAAAFVGNSDIVEILIEQVLMTRILCPVLNAQTVFGQDFKITILTRGEHG